MCHFQLSLHVIARGRRASLCLSNYSMGQHLVRSQSENACACLQGIAGVLTNYVSQEALTREASKNWHTMQWLLKLLSKSPQLLHELQVALQIL